MKKILLSIFTVALVAAAAVYGTSAFFNDTETSTGNKLEAGEIDLQIDNHSYVNQGEGLVLSPTTTWEFNEPMKAFFDFTDLKPGDFGEDTISIHLSSNPAWLCADLEVTGNSDMTCTEPENDTDAENLGCVVEGAAGTNGDLAGELNFFFWKDDGDNVYEEGEVELTHGPASNVLNSVTWALADSTTGGVPFQPNDENNPAYYIGKSWCFGTLTAVPAIQDGVGTSNPVTRETTGFTCDGTLVGNEAQTDLLTATVSFRAVQSRHNDRFTCVTEQVAPQP